MTEKVLKKAEVTVERWVQEVAKLAFQDSHEIFENVNESGVTMKDWGKVDGALIQGVSETRGKDGEVIVNVKTHDKTKNLELLGRYLKLFTQDLELKLPTPMIIKDEKGEKICELGFASNKDDNTA